MEEYEPVVVKDNTKYKPMKVIVEINGPDTDKGSEIAKWIKHHVFLNERKFGDHERDTNLYFDPLIDDDPSPDHNSDLFYGKRNSVPRHD